MTYPKPVRLGERLYSIAMSDDPKDVHPWEGVIVRKEWRCARCREPIARGALAYRPLPTKDCYFTFLRLCAPCVEPFAVEPAPPAPFRGFVWTTS